MKRRGQERSEGEERWMDARRGSEKQDWNIQRKKMKKKERTHASLGFL